VDNVDSGPQNAGEILIVCPGPIVSNARRIAATSGNRSSSWLVGARTKMIEDRATAGRLLVRNPLIDSQQDVVSRGFGGSEQFPVLSAFQPGPLRRMRIVERKAMAEVEREAFIQENLHAILASSESFASSSDRTAISRVMVGNCRRNSPSE